MLSQCETTTSPQKLRACVSPKYRFDEQLQELQAGGSEATFMTLSYDRLINVPGIDALVTTTEPQAN